MEAQRTVRNHNPTELRMIDPFQHSAFVHVRIVGYFDQIAHWGGGHLVFGENLSGFGLGVPARPVGDQAVGFFDIPHAERLRRESGQ